MSKCSEINITTENVKSSIAVVTLQKSITVENVTSNIVVCTVKGQDATGAGIGFMIIESTFTIT